MSVGQIPITAIFEYTQFYPFTEEEAHFFVDVMRVVDAAYMKLVGEKTARTAK